MRKALLAALEHDNYIEEGNDALGIAYVPPQDDDEGVCVYVQMNWPLFGLSSLYLMCAHMYMYMFQ